MRSVFRGLALTVVLLLLFVGAVWGLLALLHDEGMMVQVAAAPSGANATPTVVADMSNMHGQHMMDAMGSPGMEGQHMMGAMTALPTPPQSGSAPSQPQSTPDMRGQHSMGAMAQPGMEGEHRMGSMAGMDHGAAIPSLGVPAATEKQGAQLLTPRIENGVKVFSLTAKPVRWNILNDVTVTAWTYNGTVQWYSSWPYDSRNRG